jgi:multiple sugar transport system ATP-binding protein
MARIELRNIQKFFDAVQVQKDVNLTIEDGEFVAMLGQSGCGKTTTLRAIAGLETVSSDTISIDGRDVQGLRAVDRDIAFVFQSFSLYPHMTVQENIAFPLRAVGMSQSDRDAAVTELAKVLGIERFLHRKPSALSEGYMQRVAIGRALVRRTKALLMDEPIGALDVKLREHMRAEFKRLHIARNSTSVYVTHDQIEAMSLADRIVVMHGGLLQQVGAPEDVYNRPANLFVAQFVGRPGDERVERRNRRRRWFGGFVVRAGAGHSRGGGACRASAKAMRGQAGHPPRGGDPGTLSGRGAGGNANHQHRTLGLT